MMISTEKLWTNTSFLDANIFVYALTEIQPDKKKLCESLLEEIENGRSSFITDYLALMEACRIVSRFVSKEYAQTAFRKFLSLHNLTVIPLGNTPFFEALKNYAHSDLDFPDHIHFTIAKTMGCSQIYSYDKDFDDLDIPRVEP